MYLTNSERDTPRPAKHAVPMGLVPHPIASPLKTTKLDAIHYVLRVSTVLRFQELRPLSPVPLAPFRIILAPLGPVWHHFGDQVGQGCTQGDPHESQGGFLMSDGYWILDWSPVWINLAYVL